jgi:hypothetical protein
MVVIYSKYAKNVPTFSNPTPSEITGFFGLKIYHLATLVWPTNASQYFLIDRTDNALLDVQSVLRQFGGNQGDQMLL